MGHIDKLQKSGLEKHESEDDCWAKESEKGAHGVLKCEACKDNARIHCLREINRESGIVHFEAFCLGIDPVRNKKVDDCGEETWRYLPRDKFEGVKNSLQFY